MVISFPDVTQAFLIKYQIFGGHYFKIFKTMLNIIYFKGFRKF